MWRHSLGKLGFAKLKLGLAEQKSEAKLGLKEQKNSSKLNLTRHKRGLLWLAVGCLAAVMLTASGWTASTLTVAGATTANTVHTTNSQATSVFATNTVQATSVQTANVYAANVNAFYFSDYVVDYYLSKAEDGASRLHVVEQFTAEFPDYDQNRGFIRAIAATSNDGANTTVADVASLNLTVTRNGETSHVLDKIVYNRDADTYDVYIQNPNAYVHGQQKYVLEYDMSNVITGVAANGKTYSFRDQAPLVGQEFYWDTNGTAWSQRFERLTANVHFVDLGLDEVLTPEAYTAHAAALAANTTNTPTSALATGTSEGYPSTANADPSRVSSGDTSALTTGGVACYTGYTFSDDQNCTITPLVDGYSFTATTRLYPGENLTLYIPLAVDAFTLPVYTVTIKDFLPYILWGVVILLAGTLIGVSLYRHHKLTGENRKYYKSLLKPVQYLPPSGITVSQAAHLTLVKKIKPGAVNTLLELAVNHKIELIKGEPTGIFQKSTWQIRIKNLEGLSKSEKALLQLASDADAEPQVGDLITLQTHTASARRAALATLAHSDDEVALRKLKLLKSKAALKKNKVNNLFAPMLLVVSTMFIMPIFIYAYEAIFGEISMLALITLMGLIVLILLTASSITNGSNSKYAKLTRQGIEMAAYLDGLREYISLAEAERLQVLQSVQGADTSPAGVVKLYERLLPYAALFGYETSWLKALSRYYEDLRTAPTWCADTTATHGLVFFTMSDFASLNRASNTGIASGFGSSGGGSWGSGGSSSGFSGGGGGGFSGGGGGGGGGSGL